MLAGKPLIAWTIEAARQCAQLDRVVVSTDDAEIREVALALGSEVPFLRPAELAVSGIPLVAEIMHRFPEIKRLVISSRDKLKHLQIVNQSR